MVTKSTDVPIGGQHEKIWTIVAPSKGLQRGKSAHKASIKITVEL